MDSSQGTAEEGSWRESLVESASPGPQEAPPAETRIPVSLQPALPSRQAMTTPSLFCVSQVGGQPGLSPACHSPS